MREKSDKNLVERIITEAAFRSAFFHHKIQLFSLIRKYQSLKVEHYKDFIFDKGNGLNGNIKAAFDFMRQVPLKDITFEINNNATFKMIDAVNNREIICSNRSSENGELRGQLLMEKLKEQLKINPDLTLYAAIQNIISSKGFASSTDFEYFLNSYQDFPLFNELIRSTTAELALSYQTNPKLSNLKMAQILEKSSKKHMAILRESSGYGSLLEENELNIDKLRTADLPYFREGEKKGVYDSLRASLRKNADREYGIFSGWGAEGTWIQDATLASPLSSKASTLKVEGNTSLLRCLSRAQAIDRAMAKKSNPWNIEQMTQLRKEIKEELLNLTESVLNTSAKENPTEIKNLEKKFNTFLVNRLHDANLTEGCNTKSKAEKLLAEFSSQTIHSKAYQYTTYYTQGDGLFINEKINIIKSPYSYKDLTGFNEVGDLEFLERPGLINLEEEYQYNYSSLKQTIINYKPENEMQSMLHSKAKEIFVDIDKIKNTGDFKSLAQLNAVLYYCKNTLEDPHDLNNLTKISHYAELFSTWEPFMAELAEDLLFFSCIALAVLGVVTAVATGGISLILTGSAIALALNVPHISISSNEIGTSLADFKKILNHIKADENAPQIDDSLGEQSINSLR